jgi:hypothetical protein
MIVHYLCFMLYVSLFHYSFPLAWTQINFSSSRHFGNNTVTFYYEFVECNAETARSE